MRLWHKDLISVLPREQLIAAWRECSAIAGAIIKNGTPNHMLVNKVLDYPIDHFITYSIEIREEMTKRSYKTMDSVMNKIISLNPNYIKVPHETLFTNWHNNRYYEQCYYNLEEKYDCNGITIQDWEKIHLQRVKRKAEYEYDF